VCNKYIGKNNEIAIWNTPRVSAFLKHFYELNEYSNVRPHRNSSSVLKVASAFYLGFARKRVNRLF